MAQPNLNPSGTAWTRPAVDAAAVVVATPFATCRGLYVGVTGDVTVTMADGTSVQFVGLAAGVIHPISCSNVSAATATSIVALY